MPVPTAAAALSPAPAATFTVSGLAPATAYALRFRLVNEWGLVTYVPVSGTYATRDVPGDATGIGYAFAGSRCCNVAFCRANTGGDGSTSSFGCCDGSFGLRQVEAVFGVVDDDECVTFVHTLVLFKPYFLDESLYAGIDRCDVAVHLCIVGPRYVAEMDETAACEANGYHQQSNNNSVVCSFDVLLVHDNFYFLFS